MQQKPSPSPCFRKTVTFLYFLHLVVALSLAVYSIVQHHEVTRPSVTFAMLLIYGFMLPWALILSFLLILCKQQQKAVCLTRILLKLIIFLFPVFALLSIHKDPQLQFNQVKAFILYMAIIAALLLVYEVVSCLCCGQKYPDFLFEENDLNEAQGRVLSKRKEYDQSIGKQ